ncbi:NERD domain-containing protein [Halobacillus litoralis]|uniref:NERD domain-containing protein n=1 Tax=Halobacillus litoralis TaxID=45668 RepID=UPI001CD54E47|nr:NERD domain-containing protein [Halobacillus litoralis]MCA0972752.1 NERD domain-containing protein [Halobacillus litoralis]
MAQLIKLQDYTSRYESNIYQYPAQYIRLKKENWNKMKHLYEQGMLQQPQEPVESSWNHEEKKQGWKKFFQKEEKQSLTNEEMEKEVNDDLPQTMEELKKYFLDGLFPFQLKWASTTLREKSFVDRSYKEDDRLKYFLQRFPDTYFLMYHPIVVLRQAEMEALPILISPHGIEIIYYMEGQVNGIVEPNSENSWFVEQGDVRSKVLSPLFALQRTESFVKSVWKAYDLNFPVQKVVLAPDLFVKESQEPYSTRYIGRERYEAWLHEKRKLVSPLKHDQLKAADALLKHCQTTSFKRPEWDEDPKEFMEE